MPISPSMPLLSLASSANFQRAAEWFLCWRSYCVRLTGYKKPRRARVRARVMGYYSEPESLALRDRNAAPGFSDCWSARPLAERAAFEAKIPTEVLRQDRSAVHHEGGLIEIVSNAIVVLLLSGRDQPPFCSR
jgi:hypothetical protein